MITRGDFERAQQRAAEMIRQAGIQITDAEAQRIEAVDFGLSRLEVEGVQVLTLFATERISAKVLVMFPHQTEPEHWHPPVVGDPGKEETIRVISGTLNFYIPGADTLRQGWIPSEKEICYTCRHEIVMKPCDQLTRHPAPSTGFRRRHRARCSIVSPPASATRSTASPIPRSCGRQGSSRISSWKTRRPEMSAHLTFLARSGRCPCLPVFQRSSSAATETCRYTGWRTFLLATAVFVQRLQPSRAQKQPHRLNQ